jgi:hypothetical protein
MDSDTLLANDEKRAPNVQQDDLMMETGFTRVCP